MDEFDRLVHELESDRRAVPTDPLKTPEAIARAEQERLQQLEAARLRRMRGESDDESDLAEEDKKDKKGRRDKEKKDKKGKGLEKPRVRFPFLFFALS